MEEEGVPSTALREVSLLQMLSHSIYIVRSWFFSSRVSSGVYSKCAILFVLSVGALEVEGKCEQYCLWFRLLCVEHVEKNDKPMLYLVFEYMDTDLKKYIDLHGRGRTGSPLEAKVIQVVLPAPFSLCLQHKGVMQKNYYREPCSCVLLHRNILQ
jgi:cyclin-dependent kinase